MAKQKKTNKDIAEIFDHVAELLEINGELYHRRRAYKNAALALSGLQEDVKDLYKKGGVKELKKISGIGESTAEKIEEYLKKRKIKFYEELREKSALRDIVTHYFQTKGIPLSRLKMDAKKRKIVYARYTAAAKQLIELAGSVDEAKKAIDKVASWASTRGLDYSIETVFKKWLELDRLKPKEVVKKPFYDGHPMVWSETKKKWFVVMPDDEWREFADKEDTIEWRIQK